MNYSSIIHTYVHVTCFAFLHKYFASFHDNENNHSFAERSYRLRNNGKNNVLVFVFQNNDMDNRKAVLKLKDVPPPPPHHTSSSQPFPLAPLTLLPPCLPSPQLTQDPHQQQPPPPQQQERASPKVSMCTQCEYCRTDGSWLVGGRGVVGSSSSIAGVVSVCMAPSCLSSSLSRTDSCSVTSSVYQYKHNLNSRSERDILDPLLNLTCNPLPLSSVATSQPVSSHPYLTCCSGLLHAYPPVPLSCSKPSLYTSSATLAPPPCVSSLPVAVRGSCLASSGYYSCGVDCCPSARRSQRSTHGDLPTTTTITTTTTSAHFCSNPLHLNIERTVCLKGVHYCQQCMLKVGEAFCCIFK